jgi:adenylate kinase family enzyme
MNKRGKSKNKNKIIKKEKKNDDNNIDNNNNIINNCEQWYEKILNEMKNIKANYFRKESNKTLKTSYFTKYIENSGYSLENKKMPLIWSMNTFLKKFLSQLELYIEFEEPIKKIIEILCGDFSSAKKLKKFMNYLNDYENEPNIYLIQKLCSFYSIQLKNNNKKKILFCICLQKDENTVQNTASAFLYFISLTEEWNFEDDAHEFINKYVLSDDEKYPFVEFDKSGFFMTKELLFSEVKKVNNKEICYPLKNLSIDNKTIFNTALINKKIYHFYNNIEDFITNDMHNMLISQIENEQYEDIILEAIDGKFWKDIKLSNQEKDKIYPPTPFIISGRPGTGKTTIILVKLFVIYYNYFLKKEKLEEYYEDENGNRLVSQLRVVFTSFSQELCKEQLKSFIQMVNNVSYLAYKGIPQTEIKNISSFRDNISYPIFTNYRKLRFMIDGSLTFQFFQRKIFKNI